MKKLTINDIAKQAGVAKSTVSRYLNGGNLKTETKEKIKKIIKETQYKPNMFARLKAKEKKIIGVIIPRLDSTTASKMVIIIERFLRSKGYTVLIMNTDNDEKTELQNIETLWRMDVDGIIIVATAVTKKHEEFVTKLNIPIVFVGQKIGNGISIIHNDFDAGFIIGDYIGKHIKENIAIITVDENDIAVGQDRKNGILKGLSKNNISNPDIIYSDFSFNSTYKIIKKTLTKKSFNAIICSTDLQALAVYKVANELNIKIPDELSVTGFGGYELNGIINPQLTTIKLDSESIGHISAETMIKLLNNEICSKIQIIDFIFLEGKSVKI